MHPLPNPGWYDDPEYPAYLRYWDGTQWSDHRSEKPPTYPTSGNGPSAESLPDIGDWLGDTFRLMADRRLAIFGLFVGSALASLAMGVVVLSIWDDLVYSDVGGWEGFSAGRVVATIATLAVIALASMFVYLMAAHQLHGARLGGDPGLGDSAAAAVRAVPRAVGWAFAFGGVAVVALVVVALLGLLSPVLAVLRLLALVVVGAWAAVKLAFFAHAVVAPVEGMNSIQASAAVSDRRFWPILGRLLVLGVVTVLFSFALNIVFSAFVSTPSEADVDRLVQVDGDDIVFIDVGGLMDELDLVGPSVIISALPGSITTALALAGTAILYADTHRRRRDLSDQDLSG